MLRSSDMQEVKASLLSAQHNNRTDAVLKILGAYSTSDLIFLQVILLPRASAAQPRIRLPNGSARQEASEAFARRAREQLPDFLLLEPAEHERARNQNSLILVKRCSFLDSSARDITHEVPVRSLSLAPRYQTQAHPSLCVRPRTNTCRGACRGPRREYKFLVEPEYFIMIFSHLTQLSL